MPPTLPECPAGAFRNTSHTPERRAAGETARLAERVAIMTAKAATLGTEPEVLAGLVARHVTATRGLWASLERCASSFICGPANFPVARAQKANRAADKRETEVQEHLAQCLKRMERLAFPHGMPGDPIRANDPEAVTKLEAKLTEQKAEHEAYKAGNALIRKGAATIETLTALGISESAARGALMKLGQGYWGFHTNNSLARMKATEERLERLKKSLARPAKEVECNGVRIVENPEAQRLQMFFPGKPASPVIAQLKSHGFRWAPSAGAWQRQLTNAARYAAQQVVKEVI